jgi:hypothetical protein
MGSARYPSLRRDFLSIEPILAVVPTINHILRLPPCLLRVTMYKRKITFEKIEIFVYRTVMLIVLIFHFVKYLKFELSHW